MFALTNPSVVNMAHREGTDLMGTSTANDVIDKIYGQGFRQRRPYIEAPAPESIKKHGVGQGRVPPRFVPGQDDNQNRPGTDPSRRD